MKTVNQNAKTKLDCTFENEYKAIQKKLRINILLLKMKRTDPKDYIDCITKRQKSLQDMISKESKQSNPATANHN